MKVLCSYKQIIIMSSKEQYKDALKRQKQIIMQLNCDIKAWQKKYEDAYSRNMELRRSLYIRKKWWQFWK